MKTKPMSLCWRCQNAVPSETHGCSWSEDFLPIDGWRADHSFMRDKGMIVDTYTVYDCPQFDPDPPRDKACEEIDREFFEDVRRGRA